MAADWMCRAEKSMPGDLNTDRAYPDVFAEYDKPQEPAAEKPDTDSDAVSTPATPEGNTEGSEDAKGRKRGPDGRFVSAENDTDGGDADPQPEAKETSKPKTTYSDDDIRRAVSAAERYKSRTLSKAIQDGNEDAIAEALHLAQIQGDYDEHLKSKKAIADELASLKRSGPTGSSTDDNGADKSTDQSLDVDALVRPLAKQLEEVTGEDLSEHIRSSFAGLASNLQSEFKRRDEQSSKIAEQLERLEVERARDALISEYPDLKDKGAWERVRKMLPSLPLSDERPDMLTRLEHAARIELSPDIIKRAKAAKEQRDKSRDNGGPTPPVRTPDAKKKQDHGSLVEALADAMEKGEQGRITELKAQIQQLSRM